MSIYSRKIDRRGAQNGNHIYSHCHLYSQNLQRCILKVPKKRDRIMGLVIKCFCFLHFPGHSLWRDLNWDAC